MRTGLLILPFLALIVGATGTLVGSAFSDIKWITYSGWAAAIAIVGLWVLLDFNGFKAIFTRKGAKYGLSSGLSIVLGVLVIIGLGTLSTRARFNKSFDLSKNQQSTLADQTVKVLEKLKEDGKQIEVTAFFEQDDQKAAFQSIIDLYSRKADVLRIQYYDPRIENTKAQAANLTSGNTVIFKYGEREVKLTAFNEEKITNALVNVLKENAKKVYFTSGHGEGELKSSEPTGFELVRLDLEGSKFNAEPLSLLEKVQVPDDADLVVIAGPKYEFKAEELKALDVYLKKGGALLVMVSALTPVLELNKLLTSYGLKFDDDLLLLKSDDPRASLFGANMAIVSEFDDFSPVTKDFARQSNVAMLFPNSRSVSEIADNTNKLKVESIGETTENAKVAGVKSRADLKAVNDSRVSEGKFPVVATAAGKIGENAKETRIVAFGSAEFATNTGSQRAEHRDMLLNAVSYLAMDEDFISIRPKEEDKGTIDLSTPGSQLTLSFLGFIYPFLYLFIGIFYWLRRRRS